MTRLGSALGANYEQMRREILTRKFELGGFTFKVRIPLVAETDALYKRITDPAPELIDAAYNELTEPLLKFKEDAEATEAGFTFLENDILFKESQCGKPPKTKL